MKTVMAVKWVHPFVAGANIDQETSVADGNQSGAARHSQSHSSPSRASAQRCPKPSWLGQMNIQSAS